MPDKDKKKKRRLVSIVARTAIDALECEEVIRDCLKKLDSSKFEIVMLVENAKIHLLDGNYTTLLKITGDSSSGLPRSGMEELCRCLQSSGYFIQFIPSYHDFIPPKK